MTEKIKRTIFERGWELLIVALLGIIIGSLGWYINRITDIQDRQDELIQRLGSRQNDVMRIVYDDPDTHLTDKRLLEAYIFTLRSGNNSNKLEQ